MGRAGQLRERLRIERRIDDADGYGNQEGAWSSVLTVPGRITPVRGRERVRADRLSGSVVYRVRLRHQPALADLSTADRLVNTRTGQAFNIRHIANPDKRRRFLELLCEIGVGSAPYTSESIAVVVGADNSVVAAAPTVAIPLGGVAVNLRAAAPTVSPTAGAVATGVVAGSSTVTVPGGAVAIGVTVGAPRSVRPVGGEGVGLTITPTLSAPSGSVAQSIVLGAPTLTTPSEVAGAGSLTVAPPTITVPSGGVAAGVALGAPSVNAPGGSVAVGAAVTPVLTVPAGAVAAGVVAGAPVLTAGTGSVAAGLALSAPTLNGQSGGVAVSVTTGAPTVTVPSSQAAAVSIALGAPIVAIPAGGVAISVDSGAPSLTIPSAGGGGGSDTLADTLPAASNVHDITELFLSGGLWQDAARTTVVTAAGQTVEAIDDTSGAGNHLTLSNGSGATVEYDATNDSYYLEWGSTTMYLTPNVLAEHTHAAVLALAEYDSPSTEVFIASADLRSYFCMDDGSSGPAIIRLEDVNGADALIVAEVDGVSLGVNPSRDAVHTAIDPTPSGASAHVLMLNAFGWEADNPEPCLLRMGYIAGARLYAFALAESETAENLDDAVAFCAALNGATIS